jgi:4-amino-4-deoxy-L-arabinose transferase-like glycosyltransferase
VTDIARSRLQEIVRAPLFWLAVLYSLVGVVYALVTPAFEKPDEDGHYGYILYLREHHGLPPLVFSEGFPSEYKQPPLYYLITSALISWLPDDTAPDRLLAVNPYMDFSVPGCRNDNRNVFLHPPYMTPLVLGARLVSLLFGLGTVIAAHFLASQLLPEQSLVSMATAAVVGFQPQFLYMATAVNNDAAIALFGALAIAILVYRLQRGHMAGFAVLLGGILGLASITKVSGLVFFPLTGLALLLIHRGSCRSLLQDGITILVVALLVGGWWYARNALLYDDPLSLGVHTSGEPATRLFADRIQHDLSSIEHTFWANPSRTFVSQMWLDHVIIWWGRISLGLVAVGLLPSRRHHASRIPPHVWTVLLSWFAAFLLLLITYWTQEASWAYGRLLFPALVPIALSFVLGWLYAFPWSWHRIVMPFCAGTVVITSTLIPVLSIYPLYHPWRERTAEPVEHAVDVVYVDPETGEQVAQLVGYNLPEPYALPDTYVPVELYWKPLAQTHTRYAVFVHLLDLSQLHTHSSPGVWGERRTYPGLGNLPTDRWTPGKTFRDRVLVHVSPDAPTPLAAAIEIGLMDPETEHRLQAMSSTGDPYDVVIVRGVPVLSPKELPTAEQPASYILDNAIGLNRVQLSGTVDGTVTLTLTWQSLQPVSYDATTFVHLGGSDGNLLAQVDRQPLDGQFPTSYWLPGQVVTDTVSLSPMRDATHGRVVLTMGMYTWPSLERLPVTDADGGPQPNDAIVIEASLPAGTEP